MITNKYELKRAIELDRKANIKTSKKDIELSFRHVFSYQVYKYLKSLRKMEFVCYRRDNTKNKVISFFYAQRVKILDRRKNILGLKLGIEISPNHTAAGIRIAHPNVIINGFVDEGCILHGNNVLGNKKTGDAESVPHLGKRVDVGIGAIIIGNVEIADDCMIGAGSVVTKSFTVPGTIIAGVHAKEIHK